MHCIVGENGSGKSTLVKILSGIHRPDEGELAIGDATATALSTPRASLQAGIATVFQEVLVVEPRSVLENVWLGTEGIVRRPTSEASKRERAQAVLGELLEVVPPLDTPVEALALSDRQACCIARALVRDPRVLILDEATSALDVGDPRPAVRGPAPPGRRRRRRDLHLAPDGRDRRDRRPVHGDALGETVATLERGEATSAELVRLMTGAEHLAPETARRAARRPAGDVVLRADGVEVRAGELVGLAGLEGHGQDDFLKALWQDALADGTRVAYVPRERRAESLFESKSILENFALPTLGRDTPPRHRRGRPGPARGSRATCSGWASGSAAPRTGSRRSRAETSRRS